eukprot:c6363_g1_i1.p1 GENE.c6363_g1_i1~~c6363_g1_i1.p1  ORF type:complete len:900 (+),score=198.07 c6363_g1_i1:846-3545(+)
MVYNLERERPTYFSHASELFYCKGNFIRLYEYSSQRDTPIVSIRRNGSAAPRALHYNSAENVVLITYEAQDTSNFELYKLPKQHSPESVVEPKRGTGTSAVFVGRNKFAVLERSGGAVSLKTLEGEESKRWYPPGSVTGLFPATSGSFLLRYEDKVALYDIQQAKNVGEVVCNNAKYAYWSPDHEFVALLSKHTLTIANKRMEHLCSVQETIRLKSGAWDESGVFVYNTLSHVKYCLPNGDSGTIRTMEVPMYITKVQGDIVQCLDREGNNKTIFVDSTEFLFKAALHKRDFPAVKRIVQSSRISGHAIIGYLQKKGFPEVALHFVKDERTRFNLALQCGKIDVAKECAGAADDKECWERLAEEALKQGKLSVVEEAYQRTEAFEKLSFLYLVTGQLGKLKNMLSIAKARGDSMSVFHNALFLGDVSERVNVLKESGQVALAYVTAVTHGLVDLAQQLEPLLPKDHHLVTPNSTHQTLLYPPIPLNSLTEWPLLNVAPDVFDVLPDASTASAAAAATVELTETSANMWGDSLDLDLGDTAGPTAAPASKSGPAPAAAAGGGWGDDLELDIPEEVLAAANVASKGPIFVAPKTLPSREDKWSDRSSFVCDHVAAGDFDGALALLQHQIGAVSFDVFKGPFMSLWASAHSSIPSATSGAPSMLLGLQLNTHPNEAARKSPPIFITVASLAAIVKNAYTFIGQGNLAGAVECFVQTLHHLPLLRPEKSEMAEIEKIKNECRQYVLGLRMELKRREIVNDEPVRAAELACYVTHCNLQPAHDTGALQTAMSMTYKIQNIGDAGQFAKRLLDRGVAEPVAQKARQLHAISEQNPTNTHKLNYDMRNPFVICGSSLSPIYKGAKFEQCPFCRTYYQPTFKGTKCEVCLVSQVGAQASGLFTDSQF